MNNVHTARTSTAITLSVWKALFLREALTRLFSGRASWFWLLAEPVFNVGYMLVIFTVIQKRTMGGINIVLWLMVGMAGYLLFQRTFNQVMNALKANQSLFAYRQVKPIDTLLVRGVLEGLLMLIITSILLAGVALFGYSVIPADPLTVLEAYFGLWLVGLGLGLVVSVPSRLVSELGRVINMAMMPLYILSGVIVPLASIPQPYRGWLLLNPVAHGLEEARLGFAPHYAAIPELDIAYMYGFALVTIFLGLALHRRFALRLVTR